MTVFATAMMVAVLHTAPAATADMSVPQADWIRHAGHVAAPGTLR